MNFGSGVMNDKENEWSEDEVEIEERNEGDKFLEELDSNVIIDKLQVHIDLCGKILSFANRKE